MHNFWRARFLKVTLAILTLTFVQKFQVAWEHVLINVADTLFNLNGSWSFVEGFSKFVFFVCFCNISKCEVTSSRDFILRGSCIDQRERRTKHCGQKKNEKWFAAYVAIATTKLVFVNFRNGKCFYLHNFFHFLIHKSGTLIWKRRSLWFW